MGEIVTVNFRGDDLYGFKQDDGIYMAVKPMCEAIGIPYEGQRQRIARDPVLQKGTSIMLVPFAGAKGQEVTCLLLKRVNHWLATVDTSRIKDGAVREKVQLYQEECADVLFEHFIGSHRGSTLTADPSKENVLSESHSLRLVTEARITFNPQAGREVWFACRNLPITPAMLAHGQNDPDLFHYGMVRNDAAE